MPFLLLVLGAITGRGMMRTPISPEQGWIVAVLFGVLGVSLLVALYMRYGTRGVVGLLAVSVLGVLVEYIGVTTCQPYGCFEYGGLVGPKFMETFPYALLAIWPIIVAGIVQFVPQVVGNRGVAAFVGGCFLMLFDMVLDPVAVQQGIRAYTETFWYGVPLSNFLGRILTGTISCWLLLRLSPIVRGDKLLERIGRFLTGMYGMAFLVVVGLVGLV